MGSLLARIYDGGPMNNFNQAVIYGALMSSFISIPMYAADTKPKLSMEQATSIATKKVPGIVKSSEFEHEMQGDDVTQNP